jgi:hypothetical protein
MYANRKERFIIALRSSQECLDRLLENGGDDCEMARLEIKDTKRRLDAAYRILEEVKENEMNCGIVRDMVGWILKRKENQDEA